MEVELQDDRGDVKAEQPQPRRRALAVLCPLYAATAIAYWLLIRYASARWWPATVLLYSPRWTLLLPLLVLMPWAWRKGRRLVWLPLVTGLFVLFPLMDFNVPWHRLTAPEPHGFKLRVLTCNLHRIELNVPPLDKYIAQVQPDIVAFQDYSNWDEMSSLSGPSWHTYQVGNQILLASRYPIVHVHDLNLEGIPGSDDNEFPRRVGTAICFDLHTPAGLIHVISQHLVSPHKGLEQLAYETAHGIEMLKAGNIRRRKESALVTDWMSRQTGPFVVLGDFNMPAESPIYREFWSKYPDAFPTCGWGYGFTHINLLTELRIDHLLTTRGITCTAVHLGPPCGTPHRPLVADLVVTADR
jgi:endonuclease/exonuclease/phosphatase family metal-dependent hydrolase